MDNVINTFVAQRQNQIAREGNLKQKQREAAAAMDTMLNEFLDECRSENVRREVEGWSTPGQDVVVEDEASRNEEGFMLLGEARELLLAAKAQFANSVFKDPILVQSIEYLVGETNAVIMAHRGIGDEMEVD